ncbi:MAG: LuxR C-terminal-related transcriptional regulator [Egibacteraceae bacterium]
MPVVWPLVGRREVLRRIAEAMRRPGGAGVVLVGAAGVGKTRLAVEVLDEAGRRGLDTLWTVATEAAASIPYGPVVDLLPKPADEESSTRLDLLQRTVRSLGERRGGRGLVLGVDDAHLLDDASAALVHCLARTGTAQILATVRSGEQSPDAVTALWRDDLAARVEVTPLGEDEVHQLVCAAVGGVVDGQTLRRLWRLSEGNPLFLRELVAEALETGALVEAGGIWRGGAATMVGTRLAELVEARLRRLDPAVRAGLEVAAVGEPLEASLLEAVSASMPTDARATDARATNDGWARESPMEVAERAGLVRVDVDRRRVRLRLAHPVYGEVLRATTPVLRARAVRRGLAEALQATGYRRRDDLLRLVSWRLEGGGRCDPDLLLAAALRARALFDPALAARLAQAAVEAGAGFDASLIAAESLHTAGRAGEAEDLLGELEPAARTEADRTRVALARAANLVTGFGRAGDAEAVISRAEDVVADEDLRDELRAMRGTVALAQGRSRQALDAVSAVLGRPGASQRARVRALLVAVPAWAQTGAAETAISTTEQLVTALGRPDEQLPEVVELLRLGLCFAYGVAGRLDDARTLAAARYRAVLDQRAHDLQGGWAMALGQTALACGSARSAAGPLREAALLLRQESKAFGVYSLAWCLGCLAEASALLGDLDAAQAALQEADAVTPEPCFVPNREVGRIWVAACGGAVVAARTAALGMAATAQAHGSYAVEAFALHEAVRLGLAAEVAGRLAVLADGVVDGRLVSAYAAHAAALVAGEAPALQKVSATFEELGAVLIAAEAAAEAARAYQREGRSASARAAAGRSQLLAARCEGCRTPGLELVVLPQPLTLREREIAGLAVQGLSSQRIAERLVLSARTVDNHLHRVYVKLGVSSRTELATVLTPREDPERV